MNWLSSHFWLLIGGVGGTALVGLIGWFLSRFFKEPVETDATVAVRDSHVTSSPIAAGSRITQHNYFTPVSTSVAAPATTQDEPRPNIQQTGATVVPVNEFSFSRLLEDPTGKAQAFLIHFTNEARLDKPNAGAPVKALLIYENDNGEVFRTIGSWMHGESDDWVMFRVDELRRLIVGVLFEHNFTAIGMFRPSGSAHALIVPNIVPPFQTVRVRLTDANTGDVLYQGHFRVTLDPLGIVAEYTGRGNVTL